MSRIALIFLCVSSFASAQPDDVHGLFKSVEHQWLGEQARLYFPGLENIEAPDRKLRLPNENELGYGDIIALAGDFYGIPSAPISDGANLKERIERFKAAFADLANEQKTYRCDYDYCANKILESFASQSNALKEGNIDVALESRSAATIARLQVYTANNFLSLAIRNWDHFLPTSMLAYEAGHSAAITQALLARKITNEAQKATALELAYAMNAFADHFLTDMFSSGHLRVPRKQLYDQSNFASLAGLLANQMHDEDGRVGLIVQNKAGTTWKMFGDGMLFAQGADENRAQVSLAVQTSTAEVSEAFRTGKSKTLDSFGIKKIVAELSDSLLKPTSPELNSSPLYSLNIEGKVVARIPENSMCSYEWTDDWSGMSQYLGYSRAGDGSDCKFNPKVDAHL